MFKNLRLGTYECKLCLTLHANEGSYLSHTQGKKHQENLKRRAARENVSKVTVQPSVVVRQTVKIGRPGYKVTKIKDPGTNGQAQVGLFFQIHYPQLGMVVGANFVDVEPRPRYRFMSAYEQRVEAPDRNYQYILFAGEPYETIGFKVPAKDIDKGSFWEYWDKDAKIYSVQLMFKN